MEAARRGEGGAGAGAREEVREGGGQQACEPLGRSYCCSFNRIFALRMPSHTDALWQATRDVTCRTWGGDEGGDEGGG